MKIYNVSTNFSLEPIEPSARYLGVNRFLLALTLFRVSLGLSYVFFSSTHSPLCSSLSTRVQKIDTSLADGSISSRRKLFDTLQFKIN